MHKSIHWNDILKRLINEVLIALRYMEETGELPTFS